MCASSGCTSEFLARVVGRCGYRPPRDTWLPSPSPANDRSTHNLFCCRFLAFPEREATLASAQVLYRSTALRRRSRIDTAAPVLRPGRLQAHLRGAVVGAGERYWMVSEPSGGLSAVPDPRVSRPLCTAVPGTRDKCSLVVQTCATYACCRAQDDVRSAIHRVGTVAAERHRFALACALPHEGYNTRSRAPNCTPF